MTVRHRRLRHAKAARAHRGAHAVCYVAEVVDMER